MKREATAYDAALRAFREVTEEVAGDTATRAHVLARAQRRRTRGMVRPHVAPVAALVSVAVASGAAAWTVTERWRAEAPRVIGAEATGGSGGAVSPDGAGRPLRVIPPVPAVDESPSRVSDESGENETAAYARAHRAHFVEEAPTRALAAWSAYLASYPSGAFAPEAKYNRALCLVRLGRLAEASAALVPFAGGRYGTYRRAEATRLLAWVTGAR